MIEAVLTGFKTKVDELTESAHNTFYTAIGGRWYDTEAPQNATFPFAVIYALPAYPDYTFKTVSYIVPTTTNIFSKERANTEIDDIFAKFKTLFLPAGGADWTQLTIDGYTEIMLKPEFVHRDRSDDIWQYSIELTCRILET